MELVVQVTLLMELTQDQVELVVRVEVMEEREVLITPPGLGITAPTLSLTMLPV